MGWPVVVADYTGRSEKEGGRKAEGKGGGLGTGKERQPRKHWHFFWVVSQMAQRIKKGATWAPDGLHC